MKQNEIDRWVRRQNRMHNHTSMPAVNWTVIGGVLIVVAALVFVFLKMVQGL